MSRQFVRSLILAAVLGTANAGPCKPSGTTAAVSESTIETSTSVVSSVEIESALFTSTTEALASTTDETTITTTIDIQTTTSGAPIESSMSSSETDTPTTTTPATSTCTPPEGTVYGRQGYRTTNNHLLGLDRSGTLAECIQSCLDASGCVIAAFEQDSVCELWSEIPEFDNSETMFKWYQPACFCDVDDAASTL